MTGAAEVDRSCWSLISSENSPWNFLASRRTAMHSLRLQRRCVGLRKAKCSAREELFEEHTVRAVLATSHADSYRLMRVLYNFIRHIRVSFSHELVQIKVKNTRTTERPGCVSDGLVTEHVVRRRGLLDPQRTTGRELTHPRHRLPHVPALVRVHHLQQRHRSTSAPSRPRSVSRMRVC